jgi:hypothetical protein
MLQHATLLHARGVFRAEKLDRDIRLDRLVELDLEQVEVDELALDRMPLLLLDDDGRCLAIEFRASRSPTWKARVSEPPP